MEGPTKEKARCLWNLFTSVRFCNLAGLLQNCTTRPLILVSYCGRYSRETTGRCLFESFTMFGSRNVASRTLLKWDFSLYMVISLKWTTHIKTSCDDLGSLSKSQDSPKWRENRERCLLTLRVRVDCVLSVIVLILVQREISNGKRAQCFSEPFCSKRVEEEEEEEILIKRSFLCHFSFGAQDPLHETKAA